MKRIASPRLAAAARRELLEEVAGELYDRAAGDRPVDPWFPLDAGHMAAIREAAPAYEERVTAFFDAALRRP